jgi:glycosyltransferase involved in cell wall biosynthesis
MTNLSVVIPAYNAGPYLREAVESLLAEAADGLEVVVVDDGSTDDSLKSIEEFPVKIIRQANGGEARARNAGIRAARGRYITFLDADDLIAAGGILARAAYLDAHPSDIAVGGLPSTLIDQNGRTIADVFQRMSQKYAPPFRLTDAFYRSNRFFPVSCSLYLYRREVFDAIGGYDETLRYAPDCDFHFRFLRTMEIPVLGVRTFDRRIHADNLSIRRLAPSELVFKEDLLAVIRGINRKHGFDPKEIVPWEAEYL